MEALPQSFFLEPTTEVARGLLGCELHRRGPEGLLRGRIVEVEAYHQHGDLASHSCNGPTARNEIMFLPGGHLYVYFTYGMHFCMNVVTEIEGVGAAVLIRAVEPLDGLDVMQQRRGTGIRKRDLANGPAKLCQAFGINMRHNGVLLDGSVMNGSSIAIYPGSPVGAEKIAVSARIGITRSTGLPWRFFFRDNPWVSRGRPSA